MHKVFVLERTGYMAIGESFESDGKLYVVTNVVKVVEYMPKDKMKVQVVAQEFGTKPLFHKFDPWYGDWDSYQKRYRGGKETKENPFIKVGDIVPLSFEQDGLLGYITKIVSVTYSDAIFGEQDLIMTCSVRTFPSWSEEDMKRAVRKKRLNTFKLIETKS
ncbi:hypothetical protein [Enterococcus sp. AZ109]|uniref:hypothetical protein n=1 Tax=Enterococcus sp. AZ109 TaxID=2774634 RepID=UPI003F27A072